MTITQETTGDKNPVGPTFKGVQNMQHIHPAGAGHLDNTDIGRILETHGPSQVSGGIRTPLAAENDNFWFKNIWH
jgi:hypothetical protein